MHQCRIQRFSRFEFTMDFAERHIFGSVINYGGATAVMNLILLTYVKLIISGPAARSLYCLYVYFLHFYELRVFQMEIQQWYSLILILEIGDLYFKFVFIFEWFFKMHWNINDEIIKLDNHLVLVKVKCSNNIVKCFNCGLYPLFA